jgi:hypothetical protein
MIAMTTKSSTSVKPRRDWNTDFLMTIASEKEPKLTSAKKDKRDCLLLFELKQECIIVTRQKCVFFLRFCVTWASHGLGKGLLSLSARG